jgi:phosphate transport system ATP-binding protein
MNKVISAALSLPFGLRATSFSQHAVAETFRPNCKFAKAGNVKLDVNNLNIYINGAHILKNVNLEIPEKKITCIIGPSGCGKSTLLRTFNRLIDTAEGVQIQGGVNLGKKDIVKASGDDIIELRRRIGLVPQRPCPLPMSIYDNVAYGCRIHGIRRRFKLDSVVEYYLKSAGLWDEVKDRLHSPAARLSIGQQQRLCLARSPRRRTRLHSC